MATDEDGGEQHPLRYRIQTLEFDGDLETAKRLSEEGQRTVERQLEALDDIDAKAISILKLDLVIVSAILTIVSFATETDAIAVADLDNWFNAIAIASLVLSAALAASTYTASDSEVGVDGDAIRNVMDADLTEREFEIATAQSYAGWIEFNDRTNEINALLITLTTLLVVVAIVHLALGMYVAVVDAHIITLASIAWLFLLVVGLFAGLPLQLSRVAGRQSLADLKPW